MRHTSGTTMMQCAREKPSPKPLYSGRNAEHSAAYSRASSLELSYRDVLEAYNDSHADYKPFSRIFWSLKNLEVYRHLDLSVIRRMRSTPGPTIWVVPSIYVSGTVSTV